MIDNGHLGCLRVFGALKQQYPHLKIILSVGGAGGSASFGAVACNQGSREQFGKSAGELVNSFDLDGIDGRGDKSLLD